MPLLWSSCGFEIGALCCCDFRLPLQHTCSHKLLQRPPLGREKNKTKHRGGVCRLLVLFAFFFRFSHLKDFFWRARKLRVFTLCVTVISINKSSSCQQSRDYANKLDVHSGCQTVWHFCCSGSLFQCEGCYQISGFWHPLVGCNVPIFHVTHVAMWFLWEEMVLELIEYLKF